MSRWRPTEGQDMKYIGRELQNVICLQNLSADLRDFRFILRLTGIRFKNTPSSQNLHIIIISISSFSRLGIMLSSAQDSFKRFLTRNFPQRLHFLLGSLRSPPSQPFHERIFYIEGLFGPDEDASDTATSALNDLRSVFPLPPVQIVPREVWPYDNSSISIQTHLKSNFADAVNLIRATGRTVSEADEKYLHLLLTHRCGWSATYSEHIDDPWVKFFHTRYPQLKGLVPILDSMTYLEELAHFPDEYDFRSPEFFLLATNDSFFVYDATDGQQELRIAGETLEDVYNGMKDWRWAESSEDPWDFVEEEEYLSPTEPFPCYYRKENGNFGICWGSNEEFPGKVRTGLLQSMSDMIFGRFKY